MTFLAKFAGAVDRNQSRLCIGLDPDPAWLAVAGVDVAAFNRGVIEATADLVCCYKPNIAFYEALGREGWDALRATLDAVPRELPVLLDAKRADVASTAEAYARAVFDVWRVDAVTVNPYLGGDALEPFFRYRDRGVFVLCHTSNAGAGELQELPMFAGAGVQAPLYLTVAERVLRWNVHGNAGLVVGATYPLQLAEVRHRCPELPILVPGVGAQAGALDESARAADNGTTTGFLINASRGVTYAARPGEDPFLAARTAAQQIRDAINDALRPATAETAS